MTEPKFTKGPWHTLGYKVVDAEDFTVAKCGYTLDKTEEEAEANAALIAAAPEMYEFVKFFTTFSGQAYLRILGKPGVEIYDSAVKLCAKARREEVE